MKKGFTLIELLGTILIISALVLIVAPLVINTIKDAKLKLDEQTYDTIVFAARNWASDNKVNLDEYTSISLDELEKDGYIDENDNIKNVCVFVKEDNGNFYYKLDKKCDLLVDASIEKLYHCPDNYEKSGTGDDTICTGKTTAYKEKLAETLYNCPNGYTKTGSGSSTKCSKQTTSTTSRLSSTSYYCPSGYTSSGSGSNMTCYKTTTTTTKATASGTSYGCSRSTAEEWAGWKIQLKYFSNYDSTCSTNISDGYHCVAYSIITGNVTCKDGYYVNSTYVQSTACGAGWHPSERTYKENGDCAVIGTGSYHPTLDSYRVFDKYLVKTTNYKCPSGYTLSGTTCRKSTKTYTSKRSSISYYCPSGYKSSGSGSSMTCSKTTTTYVTPSTSLNYYCPSGYTSSGSGSNITCSKIVTNIVNPATSNRYYCEPGYTSIGTGANMQCVKNDVKN